MESLLISICIGVYKVASDAHISDYAVPMDLLAVKFYHLNHFNHALH